MSLITLGAKAMALLLLSVGCLYADGITYYYTGDPFTFDDSGPYTAADHVSLSLTLDSPLPFNQGITQDFSLVSSYIITDGVQTLTPANSSPVVIQLATENDQITQWDIIIEANPSPGAGFILTCSGGTFIYASCAGGDEGANTEDAGLTVLGGPAGTWSESPEPTAFSMASFAVLLMAGIQLVRKRETRE